MPNPVKWDSPLVKYMKGKYGEESCECLNEWVTSFGFPDKGSLSSTQLGLLKEGLLKEKEELMKNKKVETKHLEDIEKHMGCFEMWKKECLLREEKVKHAAEKKQRETERKSAEIAKAFSHINPFMFAPPTYPFFSTEHLYPRLTSLGAPVGLDNDDWVRRLPQSPPTQPLQPPQPPPPLADLPGSDDAQPEPAGQTAGASGSQHGGHTGQTAGASGSQQRGHSMRRRSMVKKKDIKTEDEAAISGGDIDNDLQLQAPMIEFPGAGPNDAAVLVHRHMDKQMEDAFKEWTPVLTRGGDSYGDLFLQFCQVWRPTGLEIKRLLLISMTPTDYRKIQGVVEDTTGLNTRMLTPEWTLAREYEQHVERIVAAIKANFPVKVNMAPIQGCRQKEDESVEDYFHRLDDTCKAHSGHNRPADPWTENNESPYEALYKSCLISGFLPEIRKGVTATLIGGWEIARARDIFKHARHAESEQDDKTNKSDQTAAMLTALTAATGTLTMYAEQQQRGRGRDRNQGPRRRNQYRPGRDFDPRPTPYNPQPQVQFPQAQVNTGAVGQGGCFVCGNPGHWAKDCPYKSRKGGRGGNQGGQWFQSGPEACNPGSGGRGGWQGPGNHFQSD